MQLTTQLLFIGNLGGWEFMLIFVAILLLFGAKKLPELARGLGKGIREFKDATTQIQSEVTSEIQRPVPSAGPGTETIAPVAKTTD